MQNIKNDVIDDKKVLKKAKNIFSSLKTDSASVIFAEEFLDHKLLKELKKSKYDVDKLLLKLVNLAGSKSVLDNGKASTRPITSKKEKQIDLPYIVLMVVFNLSTRT